MDIWKKLNLKDQTKICVCDAPESFSEALSCLQGVTVVKSLDEVEKSGFMLCFVQTEQAVKDYADAVAKSSGDVVAWFAYPKKSSKRYSSEITRDQGWQALGKHGFEGVRSVAIDEDWTGMRFRRAEFIKSMKRDPKRAMSKAGKEKLG